MIKWFERHRGLSWIIVIFTAFVIFYFSTLTFGGAGYGAGKNWMSIAYHIGIFFVLSLFLFISLIQGRKNPGLFFFSILVLISYAITDELHQFFVPGRFCSFADVGFDSIGIFFAFMIYFISLETRKKL